MYQVDGGALQTYTTPFAVSGDGQHTLTYYSTSLLGTVEPTNTLTFAIDTTPPNTTIGGGGISNGPATITLTGHDAVSGVALTQYAIDGGAWTTYTGPFTVGAGGVHTVAYRSTDVAGNIEATKTSTVQVNPQATAAPTGTVPSTLAVAVGTAAPSLGAFEPGTATTYSAVLAATLTTTAQSSTLTAADTSPTFPGHVVNGAPGGPYALAQGLQVGATDPASTAGSGTFEDLATANPATLLSFTAPASDDPVSITFRQPIAATDPLRTGAYTKTITFTLSTSTP
jgi:hypothetical protein